MAKKLDGKESLMVKKVDAEEVVSFKPCVCSNQII